MLVLIKTRYSVDIFKDKKIRTIKCSLCYLYSQQAYMYASKSWIQKT